MRLLACLIVAPQRGYDEPAILSYAISSFCPTSADGLQRSHAAELVALAPDWSKRRGPGLRFAVPRLQYSNDETLPKSGAVREDHHADTTQIHRHDAGRRPSAHHKRTTGAAAARKQAHDRRRPGAFLESKFAGLALGSGCQAAIAGTIHHRARAANDGRSWRRPRSHRAAGPERP